LLSDGGQGSQILGDASSPVPHKQEPPRGSCKGEEEAKEQLFLFIGGFLAGHLLGNGGAEFSLRLHPRHGGRTSGEATSESRAKRNGLVLLADAFGFEGFTAVGFLQLAGACVGRSGRFGPVCRGEGGRWGCWVLQGKRPHSSAAQAPGDPLLCPSYGCSGSPGKFLPGICFFPSAVPLYPSLPSGLTEEVWVRSGWSSHRTSQGTGRPRNRT